MVVMTEAMLVSCAVRRSTVYGRQQACRYVYKYSAMHEHKHLSFTVA